MFFSMIWISVLNYFLGKDVAEDKLRSEYEEKFQREVATAFGKGLSDSDGGHFTGPISAVGLENALKTM